MASIYEINKGINRPIEFKGFRAQYITYLAIGLVALLLSFAIGYMIGIPSIVLLIIVGGSGFWYISRIYTLSKKHGEHGLMKVSAYQNVPTAIIIQSRKPFFRLKSPRGKL